MVLFIIGIFFNLVLENGENPILFDENGIKQKKQEEIQKNEASDKNRMLGNPSEGLAGLIGKKAAHAEKLYGKPSRVDSSSYGYDWWIYNQDSRKYFQLAVDKGRIVSAYGIGKEVDVTPFKIGQTIDEIYSSAYVETLVDIDTDTGSYRFELSEEDMNMRPLIKLGSGYAQLYLDKFTGSVSSVRFLNEETLLKQKPYELTYRGELLEENPLSEDEWKKVEAGSRRQVFDITNIMRQRFGLAELKWDEKTSEVAFKHSNDMSEGRYFSHNSPTNGNLEDRLAKGGISYRLAGENIAANYVDAIAAMEGWLNSKGHREALLNKEFTHVGVGVYRKYYTQNFIASEKPS
ncbi:CAP domain-containing protein [Bacillus sp. V5-8f]|uniref:CAP domain-containing protein n=1 Tax=Bacillus sp. V5-8f TaxID=2053044 RepID=UPI00215527F6|nr:CAP domain-containing protein [Bacillus sp. V5-8f]